MKIDIVVMGECDQPRREVVKKAVANLGLALDCSGGMDESETKSSAVYSLHLPNDVKVIVWG